MLAVLKKVFGNHRSEVSSNRDRVGLSLDEKRFNDSASSGCDEPKDPNRVPASSSATIIVYDLRHIISHLPDELRRHVVKDLPAGHNIRLPAALLTRKIQKSDLTISFSTLKKMSPSGIFEDNRSLDHKRVKLDLEETKNQLSGKSPSNFKAEDLDVPSKEVEEKSDSAYVQGTKLLPDQNSQCQSDGSQSSLGHSTPELDDDPSPLVISASRIKDYIPVACKSEILRLPQGFETPLHIPYAVAQSFYENAEATASWSDFWSWFYPSLEPTGFDYSDPVNIPMDFFIPAFTEWKKELEAPAPSVNEKKAIQKNQLKPDPILQSGLSVQKTSQMEIRVLDTDSPEPTTKHEARGISYIKEKQKVEVSQLPHTGDDTHVVSTSTGKSEPHLAIGSRLEDSLNDEQAASDKALPADSASHKKNEETDKSVAIDKEVFKSNIETEVHRKLVQDVSADTEPEDQGIHFEVNDTLGFAEVAEALDRDIIDDLEGVNGFSLESHKTEVQKPLQGLESQADFVNKEQTDIGQEVSVSFDSFVQKSRKAYDPELYQDGISGAGEIHQDELTARLTKMFLQPEKKIWTVKEIIRKASLFEGIIGLLVFFDDGLMIGSEVPGSINVDQFLKEAPTMFSQASHICGGSDSDLPEYVSVYFQDQTVHAFKSGNIFLIAFSNPEVQIPRGNLKFITTYLSRKLG